MAAAVLAGMAITAGGWRFMMRDAAVVQAAVRFEVRLAETQPAKGLREARVAGSDEKIYLYPDAVVTNADISESRVIDRDQSGGHYSVTVSFTASGAEKMRRATARHIGKPMAIIVDGEVVAAPTVRDAVGSEAVLTGNYTRAEAERIANGMRVR